MFLSPIMVSVLQAAKPYPGNADMNGANWNMEYGIWNMEYEIGIGTFDCTGTSGPLKDKPILFVLL